MNRGWDKDNREEKLSYEEKCHDMKKISEMCIFSTLLLVYKIVLKFIEYSKYH